VPSTARIELRISMHRTRANDIEEMFWRVSDPTHAEYGQYLTLAEVQKLVAPSVEQMHSVREWLQTYDIGFTADSKYVARLSELEDEIIVNVLVTVAEDLLHTQYRYYEHTSGARLLRTSSYSIPQALSTVIAYIGPTVHLNNHVESLRMPNGQYQSTADALRGYDDTGMRAAVAAQQLRDSQRAVGDPPACSPYVDLLVNT
jgi:subtilase family serine protease